MIYFAQPTNGGPIRIGASAEMNARKRTMGTWIPGGIETVAEIEGGFLGEHVLHWCFEPLRVERDWFRSCLSIWKFVDLISTERPDWIPMEWEAIRFPRDEVVAEYGSSEAAAAAFGMSILMFETNIRWASSAGHKLSSRVIFNRLLRDGKLPDFIADLHLTPSKAKQSEAAV